MGNTKAKDQIVPPALEEDDIEFLIQNTEYDRDEIIKWHTSFIKDCPCGFLEKKELIRSFQRLYPGGKPDKICSKLFNAFDQDKNKRVDFVEYLIGISHLSSLDIKKKLQLTFRIYDHHNKGRVSRKEMEKMIVAIFELNGIKSSRENSPKEKANNIFKRFNRKNSNYINQEEFINGCLADDYLIDLFAEYRI